MVIVWEAQFPISIVINIAAPIAPELRQLSTHFDASLGDRHDICRCHNLQLLGGQMLAEACDLVIWES